MDPQLCAIWSFLSGKPFLPSRGWACSSKTCTILPCIVLESKRLVRFVDLSPLYKVTGGGAADRSTLPYICASRTLLLGTRPLTSLNAHSLLPPRGRPQRRGCLLIACPFCPSRFRLRKHLGTHVAMLHVDTGSHVPRESLPIMPHVLYAFATFTRSLGPSATTRDLKHACGVPVTCARALAEIREVEQADRVRAKGIRAGKWDLYRAPPPPLQALGPPQPAQI